MSKKSKKPWLVWGIVILVIAVVLVLLLTVVNKKDETPTFQTEGTTLVKYNGKDENVVIPSEITHIGKMAFKGNTKIKSVKTEKGSDLETIGVAAFENCSALSSVSFAEGLVEIGDYAFGSCVSLKTFIIPNTVQVIGECAFTDCVQLNMVSLSRSLKVIEEEAFKNCLVLNKISLPSSLETIGDNVFVGCPLLDTLSVDSANNSFVYEGGILYTADYSEIVLAPDPDAAVINVLPTVKKIRSNSFHNTSAVIELHIPATVEEIELNAFVGCVELTKLTVPFIGTEVDSDNSFQSVFGATLPLKLTEITVLQGTKINDKAFQNITSVKTITLPTTISSIGEYAFAGCNSLVTVNNLPSTLKSIAKNMFKGCTQLSDATVASIITNSVVQINEGAFADCAKLTSVVVPSSVKFIDKGAFAGCQSLASISLPFVGMGYESNKIDGTLSDKFNVSTNLGHIFSLEANPDNGTVVPRTLKSVTITGDYDIIDKAFINCERITSITIPSTVKKIGVEAFRNCTALKEFAVPTSLEHMGASAFENCSSLTEFNLPSTITELSESVFSSCSQLTKLDITHITYIGKYALFNCKKLEVVINGLNDSYEVVDSILYKKGQTEIIRYPSSLKNDTFTVPSTVKVICEGAFQNCGSLKTLIIPTTVEEIQINSIVDCDSLENITIPFIGNLPETANAEDRNTNFKSIFGGITPEQINVTVLSGTVVDNDAFANVAFVNTVNLAESFETIGLSAFENCPNLTAISFGTNSKIKTIGSRAFSKCTALTSLNIPSTVSEIGDFAFADCNKVESVTFPKGLEVLGVGAFKNWSKLSTVNIDADNDNYKVVDGAVLSADGKNLIFYIAGSESKSFNVPEGVENIYSYAFSGAHNIETVTFSNSVKNLSEGLFYDCTKLTSISLPSGVSTIPYSMFENCKKLTKVENISSITVIEGRAFKDCKVLVAAPINSNVVEIGENAFEGCAAISEVTIPDAITEIKKATFKDCTNLTTVKFNDSITTIADSAFYNCRKLGNYVLPETLETIGQYAFASTVSNQSLYRDQEVVLIIPDSVTEIGFRAFQGALYIKKIYLPETVTTIAEGGVNAGAGTSIFSNGITVTVNEETSDKTYTFPEGWVSFATMQTQFLGKDEFTYNAETGELISLLPSEEEETPAE